MNRNLTRPDMTKIRDSVKRMRAKLVELGTDEIKWVREQVRLMDARRVDVRLGRRRV